MWEYVCKQLGVELNTKFKLENNLEVTYRITTKGLEFYNTSEDKWKPSPLVEDFLENRLGDMVLLPWRPEYGEYYWFVTWDSEERKEYVKSELWLGNEVCQLRFVIGNYFQTKEQALACKKDMIEKMEELEETYVLKAHPLPRVIKIKQLKREKH